MSWSNVAIDEIFEVARGGSPRPIQKFLTDDADGINWVMISDASLSNKYITKTKQRIIPEGRKKSREVKTGDFLLTNSMSFGRPYIMKTSGCIHDGWLLLRPRSEQVHQDFFYHLLGSSEIYARFAARAPGSTVKNLNSEIVRETLVPLPPLEEQKRIAAILDQADSLRRLRQRAIDRLNTLGQAIFYEMFGDPIANQKGWPSKSLEELCDSINDCPHSTPTWTDKGVTCLRTSNITIGSWAWSDKRYVSEEAYHERSKRGYLKEGDIVLSREGTVGIAAIVPHEARWCMGQRLVQVRPSSSVMNSECLLRLLLYVLAPDRINHVMVGSTSRHLNVKELRKLRLIVPPLYLQNVFSERMKAISAFSSEYSTALMSSTCLISSLQHRAFRGEL
ncbi:restriction endonuclease subunit S [Thiorhodococcus mannitoliphagus]|uniref:Restriction endonuclease subunit S n=1 Tax=Thiorhodococcus mannitoliphagus TaxID=329406 RepID=A0A6P1DWI6_9GAMM|nr:restriction endonuclease subunit S [Thiorhodococcus mannitoliphagus]NEX21503.1 restriction endonuclease subunit S [Thiorhodococcus mannitoliphagus]